MKKIKSKLIFGIVVSGLFACSHGPVVQDFPDTASPGDEVHHLDADLTTAANEQVDVLSPSNFASSREALDSAKQELEHQKDAKDVLHDVAVGRAYLNRANQFAVLSHTNMDEVPVARQQAVLAGAPALFSADFKSADQSLKGLTHRFEDNDISGVAENREKLQAKYLDLELRSIKQARLGQSRELIKAAQAEGAKEFAPRTMAIAERDVNDADAFITANRHETAQVKSRSDAALASANHLLKITRDSKTNKTVSSEETSLSMEREHNEVQDQQIQLASGQDQLDRKQGQLDDKQKQLVSEQNSSDVLAAQNQALENDKAFNRSFDEARAEFTASEAEVYKQGNTLTIRLKGLEFPSSKAVLTGVNFPLLAKVQKVIKDFGQSTIVVQGHTDSVGGPDLNDKLSTARALAVKEYLVANEGTEPLNITSIGYGYQKPLASNKTASGRAQNRRVDVLIERKQVL